MEEKSVIETPKTNVKKIIRNRKKYDEFINLFQMINILEKDKVDNIYYFINEIDKEMKTDKFVSLILNQKDINKIINEYICDNITKERNFRCIGLNTDYIIKNGISHIKGLIKCNKDYLSIFCDKLFSVLESEYKVKIPTFKNIDFTDFKSAYKIVDILNYKFKYEFENIKELNLPKNFIEIALFDSHTNIAILIEILLSAYKILGGKTDINIRTAFSYPEEDLDDLIYIKNYEYETGVIEEFAEEIFNLLIEEQKHLFGFSGETNLSISSGIIPKLEICKEVTELISKKSKKVVEEYKNVDFSKYPTEERRKILHSYIYKVDISYWLFMNKFLRDIDLLLYFKRHTSRSVMICTLCNYGLLDESFKIISIEIAIEVYKHLYNKRYGKIAKIKDTIKCVYKNAKDLFNK